MLKAAQENLTFLLPKTKLVFEQLAVFEVLNQFTFVGGSALAIYLKHRRSEDLDFFSSQEHLPKLELFDLLNKMQDVTILNDDTKQLDTLINGVKVTFFANNWDKLNDCSPFLGNTNIAKFNLLIAMKVNTLFLRAKYRDYYDLYAIAQQGLKVHQIFDIAKSYLPPLNEKMFQMAIGYAEDIIDDKIQHLQPKYEYSAKQIAKYFQKQVANWINQ